MFRRALIDAFKWSVKWYLGSFSGAIGTFFFFQKQFDYTLVRSLKYALTLLVLTFLIKTIYQYIKLIDDLEKKIQDRDETINIFYSRKEKKKLISTFNYYGESIIILKDVFSKFHFLRKQEKIEKKEIITALIFLCNNVKELFEKRFKHNYSVCIKILGPNVDFENITGFAQVNTLCRDEKSYRRRSQPNNIEHNIFDNTCFNEIFHNIDDQNKSHYINNDLAEDRYYKNTSSKIYGEIPEECITTEQRRKNWTLPYKSELVVPIVPIDLENKERKKQFLGYLCVDCNEEDAFHIKYDIAMLKGIADGIFDIIKHTYNKN